MKLFNAYIKKSEDNAIDDLVFIKDGTCYQALFFNIIWFLYHKMWKISLILLVLMVALFQKSAIADNYLALFVVTLSASLWISVNANEWYSRFLEKKDYQFSGCVFAKNKEMAKLRFIEGYLESRSGNSNLFSAAILRPETGKTK